MYSLRLEYELQEGAEIIVTKEIFVTGNVEDDKRAIWVNTEDAVAKLIAGAEAKA